MRAYVIASAFLLYTLPVSVAQVCDFEDMGLGPDVPILCSDSTDLENAPIGTNPVPFKEISVMFHIVQDGNGDHNFSDSDADNELLQRYVDEANRRLANLVPSRGEPDCLHDHIAESRLRISNRGVKYYQHADFICTDTRCVDDRNEVFEYCVRQNLELTEAERETYFPIIIVGWRGDRQGEYNDCGRDGCPAPDLALAGVGEDFYVMLRGVYAHKGLTESIVELLLEELCHSFGLGHIRFAKDCCPIWKEDHTNNLMDTDNVPPSFDGDKTLVPCQLGILHWHMEHTFRRKYISDDLCSKQEPSIVIPPNTTVTWILEEYVTQDVHVYGTLIIKCAVHLADEIEMREHDDGKIILDGGIIDRCAATGQNDLMVRQSCRITVFPNPFTSHVIINTSCIADAINLYSIDGVLVGSVDPKATEIDLNLLPSGTYLLGVQFGGEVSWKRLLKM